MPSLSLLVWDSMSSFLDACHHVHFHGLLLNKEQLWNFIKSSKVELAVVI